MSRALGVLAASVVTLAGAAIPQHPALGQDPPRDRDAVRREVLRSLLQPPRVTADTARAWWSGPVHAPLRTDTRSALLAVPGSPGLVLAEPAALALAFRAAPDFRDLVGGDGLRPCGRWDTWMPGPFVHRTFAGGDILIAMQTGNAAAEVTIAHIRWGEDTGVLRAVGVRHIRSIAYEHPWPAPERRDSIAQAAAVVDWDAAERVALVAFYDPMWASQGVVVARVELPARLMTPHSEASMRIDGEFVGLGTDCRSIRIDGRLHLFARRPSADRLAPVDVHVRGEAGWTLAAGGRPEGLRAEPEYVVWADAAGRVHLTTPRSTPVETEFSRLESNRNSIQTFVTYRRIETPAGPTWQHVPMQIAWTGRMLLGPQLAVFVTDDAPPALAFRTAEGEIVIRPFTE